MVGSGTPPGAISCSRTLPRAATRIVTWIAPSISGLCGSVVTEPVHVPARPFSRSNAVGAPRFVELASCPSEPSSARAGRPGASSPAQRTMARHLTRYTLGALPRSNIHSPGSNAAGQGITDAVAVDARPTPSLREHEDGKTLR